MLSTMRSVRHCSRRQLEHRPPRPLHVSRARCPQMQHFGQTPCQLWRERPHPKRSASAAVNTIQVVPLLVALAAEQQLASTREQLLPGTVRFLAAAGSGRVGVGGTGGAAERTFASCQRSCLLVVQTQQLLQYGFADGTVRSLVPRKSGGGAACCFHGLHFGEPVNAACITSGAPPLPSRARTAALHGRAPRHAAPCHTVPHRACAAPDGHTLVTADALGGLAVWRLLHPPSGSFHLEPRGRLASHATAVCSVACDASQQV